ncbi:hypothetical protein COJ96_06085 [Bacillus sp. AFS073361]|uniref:hypothetical protein n=1 Tax=Bacillus sp. AFS073361 TaxID=2033511 RepID=UPI000BF9CA2C|nr:hypothetical protein [Bacillus sp. AFS073361]PFP30279.1 hypothetical protein COJ96_06085 [Bacillus sp. AFS073361]
MKIAAYIFIAILFAWGAYSGLTKEPEARPMSASSMTEQQRDAHDSAIILKHLGAYGVERVEIGYGYDSIKVHLKAKSSDQYVSDKASDIKDAIRDILENNRADLTLEKEPGDYYVYIYGKDAHLIN